jgi:hypothetical protein
LQQAGCRHQRKAERAVGDKSGKQYYAEMKKLDVDTKALWATLEKTCNPGCGPGWRSAPTAGCAPTAVFLPGQQQRPQTGTVLQDPIHPGRNDQTQGQGGQRFHAHGHGHGLVQVLLLQPLRHLLPLRHRHGGHVRLPSRVVLLPGIRALGTEDRLGHAPHLQCPDGHHHRGLGGHLRVDGRGV